MFSPARIKAIAAGATTLIGAVALLWQAFERPGRGRVLQGQSGAFLDAARSLNRGAGLLAFSVAADSALEHYRGDFQNRAMYTPLLTSGLSLLVSAQGQQDPERHNSVWRNGIYSGTALTGLVGTGFHLLNIGQRPGGLSWSNLFYAAPVGAPAALVLSGLLGHYSERLRAETGDLAPRIFGLPTAESLGLMSAAGLLGTSLETALLHFRGAFQNPAMYIPVSAPPLAALLLAAAVIAGPKYHALRWSSRLLLRFTAVMGFAGAAFHALGIARNHGGWRNWRQNLQAGPPLPAPPSFTGLALAGLATHTLLDHKRGQ
jgi:hypothetical protein